VDIESHYLNAAHLAELNDKTEPEIADLLSRATAESLSISIGLSIRFLFSMSNKPRSLSRH